MSRIQKIILILFALAVLGLSSAGYFYYQLYMARHNPEAASKKETADLVEKVSKLMVLPEGETPTIATVSDPEALKDQTFFARAEIGDKVLIYAESKKAILYSVSLNKILDVAPLSIGEKTDKTAPN